ncbi:MAG: Lrp/AsnC family transcriptional regulator [Boseongicola sp. SB0664_bin_43]|uniref:Lrp/AsnC family transcriptional regulator n=1 Tax=Boseongicola sp. SB0664_bin_43 TaxID=2604844 RepID=A0A6B0Y0J7_9RHOB|nr:Lrp/AsnC family transcriptional regulator [Boseongicola sp. SB0664_bin_43]MYK30491.1 Lrp/AsnC family transcriptional regulator [Boseongicola sp. SB0670_bin_30]
MTGLLVRFPRKPGTGHDVADTFALREIRPDPGSVDGGLDSMTKLHAADGEDVGNSIHGNVLDIDGMVRT